MSDPLAVLPLALAAGGGRVDDHDAGQLVAAGHALLRGSAPLVRALQGRRSAILLPTSPAFVTALAASDGRGAVLVNPLAAPREVAHQLADADVGAVFTTGALAARLPAGLPRVLLDDAPRRARVEVGGEARDVDLAAHAGDALALAGDTATAGRDEEAAVVYTSAMAGRPLGAVLTHRNLVANGRSTVEAGGFTPLDHSLAVLPFTHLFGLVVSGVAPLFAGGRVTTMERFHPIKAADLIAREGVTAVVGVPAVFAALLQAVERRGGLGAHALRVCICGGAPLAVEVQERWHAATGVELRQGYGLTEAGPGVPVQPPERAQPARHARRRLPGRRGGDRRPRHRRPCPGRRRGRDLRARRQREPRLRARRPPGPGAPPRRLAPHRRPGLGRRRRLRHLPRACTSRCSRATASTSTRASSRRRCASCRACAPWPRAPVPSRARERHRAPRRGDVSADDVKRWCAERLSAYKQPSEVTATA
jgi:acyl-CoA synthetase (AMP-forming)/AMP-acid ligase II